MERSFSQTACCECDSEERVVSGKSVDLVYMYRSFTAVELPGVGLKTVLLLRPGNAPLPGDHGFPTASSLLEI